ncbi:MAG: hypothetical protein ACP5K6_07675 [Dictyoglomus sp.]|uniref:hypothetical protein n=1 Tax=Dictyoglomus sp. TaxID=28205 RepID=UPI003CAE7A73
MREVLRNKKLRNYLILFLTLLIFLVYSYYDWLKDSPWREKWKNLEKYVGKEVTLKGEAVSPYGIWGSIYSAYSLTFENFQITVLSTTGIPAEGENLIVTGEIKKNFEVVGFWQGKEVRESYPMVLIEKERREIR